MALSLCLEQTKVTIAIVPINLSILLMVLDLKYFDSLALLAVFSTVGFEG